MALSEPQALVLAAYSEMLPPLVKDLLDKAAHAERVNLRTVAESYIYAAYFLTRALKDEPRRELFKTCGYPLDKLVQPKVNM